MGVIELIWEDGDRRQIRLHVITTPTASPSASSIYHVSGCPPNNQYIITTGYLTEFEGSASGHVNKSVAYVWAAVNDRM